MIQLTLTLKMTTAQVVETSVTVNNNSPFQDYVHPDDQTQPTFEMTSGFKPFTIITIMMMMMMMMMMLIMMMMTMKNDSDIDNNNDSHNHDNEK